MRDHLPWVNLFHLQQISITKISLLIFSISLPVSLEEKFPIRKMLVLILAIHLEAFQNYQYLFSHIYYLFEQFIKFFFCMTTSFKIFLQFCILITQISQFIHKPKIIIFKLLKKMDDEIHQVIQFIFTPISIVIYSLSKFLYLLEPCFISKLLLWVAKYLSENSWNSLFTISVKSL